MSAAGDSPTWRPFCVLAIQKSTHAATQYYKNAVRQGNLESSFPMVSEDQAKDPSEKMHLNTKTVNHAKKLLSMRKRLFKFPCWTEITGDVRQYEGAMV
jgi:hypothetical protein